jgi:uncharacterized RDD family membrane protein YckC
MPPAGDPGAPPAALSRRAAALFYEALLLLAVLFIGALPFVMAAGEAQHASVRLLFQLYLVGLTGAYYTWQWRRGRTLPMKTWRLRIVTRDGAPPGWKQAWLRYLIALPGTLLLGAGFLWALVDRERLFLHDRIAGTRIVSEQAGAGA